jgi:hypothetical protein
MKLFLAAITSAALLAISTVSRADPVPTIHYAPAENVEHIDVALIDSAQREINLAARVLTDWPVIQALNAQSIGGWESAFTSTPLSLPSADAPTGAPYRIHANLSKNLDFSCPEFFTPLLKQSNVGRN